MRERFPEAVSISAATGEGVDELLEQIAAHLEALTVEVEAVLPYAEGPLLARLHDAGRVVSAEHEDRGVRVRVRARQVELNILEPYLVGAATARWYGTDVTITSGSGRNISFSSKAFWLCRKRCHHRFTTNSASTTVTIVWPSSRLAHVLEYRISEPPVRRLDELERQACTELVPLPQVAFAGLRVQDDVDGVDLVGRECLGVFDGVQPRVVGGGDQNHHDVARRQVAVQRDLVGALDEWNVRDDDVRCEEQRHLDEEARSRAECERAALLDAFGHDDRDEVVRRDAARMRSMYDRMDVVRRPFCSDDLERRGRGEQTDHPGPLRL